MWDALWLVVTLAVAAAGGLLFRRLRVPSGVMVGALVAVASLNIFTGDALYPAWLRTMMQIATGAMIGSRIRRSDIARLRSLAAPLCVMVPCLVAMNLLVGFLIHTLGGFDLATALASSAPGGVAELSLIAADIGANTAHVSVMQLFRLFGVVSIFPPLLRTFAKVPVGEKVAVDAKPATASIPHLLLTAAVATAGGLLGQWLKIPAGAMIGSMVLCAVCSAAFGRIAFPPVARPPLQVLSGAYVGSLLSMATILSFGELVIPLLILFVSLFANTFGIGTLLWKVTKLPRLTALFASTPGGLPEMTLIADDANADVTTVSLLQTARLFVSVLLIPPILQLAVRFFI